MNSTLGFGKTVELSLDDAIEKITALDVDFMDLPSVMSLVEDPGVEPLAAEVKGELQQVMAAL